MSKKVRFQGTFEFCSISDIMEVGRQGCRFKVMIRFNLYVLSVPSVWFRETHVGIVPSVLCMSTFAPTVSKSDAIGQSFAQIHHTLLTTIKCHTKSTLPLFTLLLSIISPDDAKSALIHLRGYDSVPPKPWRQRYCAPVFASYITWAKATVAPAKFNLSPRCPLYDERWRGSLLLTNIGW